MTVVQEKEEKLSICTQENEKLLHQIRQLQEQPSDTTKVRGLGPLERRGAVDTCEERDSGDGRRESPSLYPWLWVEKE